MKIYSKIFSLFSNLLGTVTALGIGESILPKIDERIFDTMQKTMMTRFEELGNITITIITSSSSSSLTFNIIKTYSTKKNGRTRIKCVMFCKEIK